MKRLRVGITIGLQYEGETLWNNGIKQNALFLAAALGHSELVSSVCLVNTSAVSVSGDLPWDRSRWTTLAFDEAKDCIDLMIELGGQISAEQTDYLKRRGAWLVSYCCGSEYVSVAESILFGRPLWGFDLFVNQRYDAIWMVPQVANNSRHFFTTLRRRPAQVVPFVWDPVFLDDRSRELPAYGAYRSRPGAKRLSVMEPNYDVVKFCLYPILIAEQAWRRRPQSVEMLHVTNTEYLAKSSKEFIALMNQLDIVRNHKAVFLGRHDTPCFLSERTDVVISHQWDNPLNYFYLEVCWQGYPLVHNAKLCSGLGYYYEDNDVEAGCSQLIAAIETHDAQADSYLVRQREAIGAYLPSNRSVVTRYDELLLQLTRQPPI